MLQTTCEAAYRLQPKVHNRVGIEEGNQWKYYGAVVKLLDGLRLWSLELWRNAPMEDRKSSCLWTVYRHRRQRQGTGALSYGLALLIMEGY